MSDERAQEIARGALRIDWWDTESAARRVAEYAADLAPTDAQIKAHPKVQALVEALTRIEDYALADGTLDFIEGLASAALSAMIEEKDDE